MNMQEYLEKMKKIQSCILEYIEDEENIEEHYQNIIKILDEQEILKNKSDAKTILHLLAKISNHHHRSSTFFEKIAKLLQVFKEEIKSAFSNWEIFKIFKGNKRVLLFLVEEQILTIDFDIISELFKVKYLRMKYPEYFSIEIKPLLDTEIIENYNLDKQKRREDEKEEKEENNEKYDKEIDDYDLIEALNKDEPDDFIEKRKIGENDDEVCEIIRKDLIEEFITLFNKNSYSIDSQIKESIYETNSFLLKNKKTNLIQYAAFFGATQIFKYLYQNGATIVSSLWLYAIHGDDSEIITMLLEHKTGKIQYSYDRYILECFKCHHNHIVSYFDKKLSNKKFDVNYFNCIKYYNFAYMPTTKVNNMKLFCNACQYDYTKIVDFFLETKKVDIAPKKVFTQVLSCAANKDNQEVLDLLLSQNDVDIPDYIFHYNESLTRISFPLTVKSIGKGAFIYCFSLMKVTIPSSVTRIENKTFCQCFSLRQVSLPGSLTYIGGYAFYKCLKLREIEIPNSVESIGCYAFGHCQNLKHVSIPSSVKSLGSRAFDECTSLADLSIPWSLGNIGSNAFPFETKVTRIPNC